MKNELLIITNYFPPEIGAASNRIHHLAEGFVHRNQSVHVITPLPNYPTGKIFKDFKGVYKKTSEEKGIKITRLWIYASNSRNKFLRLLAMLSYSFSLIWYFLWNKLPKTVIVQSPPLLVAFTCMLFLKRNKRNLILNVSDLWPIAGLELGALKKNTSYKALERIERFNYRRANLIMGQSEEILSHVKKIIDHDHTFLYRNYPEFKPLVLKESKSNAPIKMVYAGLLGIAQGVLRLCQEIKYDNIELHIYGSGAEQGSIEHFIETHPNLPIYYHGKLTREELHEALIDYDVAIIPLLNRIYGSVPSKIFEYSRLGLPLLYFGGGEGESIVKEFQLGWTAQAGNYEDLNRVINAISTTAITIDMKESIQKTAIEKFNASKQLDDLSNMLYPPL